MLKHLGKCLLLFISFTLSNPGEVLESYNEVHDRKYYEQRGDILWEVPIHKKMIALTFDDGPHPKITPQILDLLNQYEAKATFFVVGNRIDKNTDIILREINEGHEIGNHTFNHAMFNRNVSKQKISSEIEMTARKLQEAAHVSGGWFRPPGGYYNDRVVAAAKEQGYKVVMWSWHQDTEDWKRPGVKKIAQKVINNARNGDIVLMHDFVQNSNQTIEALKIILPELAAQGYQFVTISQLLEAKHIEEMMNEMK